MALHWPTFITRAGSALVFSVIMIYGFTGPIWLFPILLLLLQFLCITEYVRLLRLLFPEAGIGFPLLFLLQIVAAAILGMVALIQLLDWEMHPLALLSIFPACFLIIYTLKFPEKIPSLFIGFSGLLYITLPLVLLYFLRLQSVLIPLSLLCMIWVNDTMAYITGSLMGRTPFSKISPKKTWEGTLGGVFFTLAVAYIWGKYTSYMAVEHWIALALCAAVAGTMGDLFESQLKRLAGVKDSGNILPGHGGALDRLDSLLFTIPFAFTYAMIFMPEVSTDQILSLF